MPEAIQDCPQVSDFYKAINVALEDNLILNSKGIVDVAIKCGIYRGDALSPLQFCIALNPLSALLDRITFGYQFKSGTTFNHLLYMDDFKLYATNVFSDYQSSRRVLGFTPPIVR